MKSLFCEMGGIEVGGGDFQSPPISQKNKNKFFNLANLKILPKVLFRSSKRIIAGVQETVNKHPSGPYFENHVHIRAEDAFRL